MLTVVFPTPPLPRKKVSFVELEVLFATGRGEHEGHEGTEKVTELMKTADFSVSRGFVTFVFVSPLLQTAQKDEKLIVPQSLT